MAVYKNGHANHHGSILGVVRCPRPCQAGEAYPIAVHTSTLAGMQPGDSTGDIFNGVAG